MILGRLKENRKYRERIKTLTGVKPKNLKLYKTAFTHKNFGKKHNIKNNETLEFVGDSVLSTIIAENLYHKFPNENEGMLTEMRSKIVNRKSLNRIGTKMGLSEIIKVPKGQRVKNNSHIVGNVLEALIGAVFIDRGYKATRMFVNKKIVQNYLNIDELVDIVHSYKNLLLNWAAQNNRTVSFEDKEIRNQGEKRRFEVSVLDDKGHPLGKAQAYSKKEASQLASQAAIEHLEESGQWNS